MAEDRDTRAPMTLSVAFPSGGGRSVSCDSVRFRVPDGADGKKTGGLVGIRRGHVDALMAVNGGEVLAFRGGEEVLRLPVCGGLAMVTADRVTILAESPAERADDGGEESGSPRDWE